MTSSRSWSTQRIALMGLLCALTFIMTFIEFPIFADANYLKIDPSNVVILVTGYIFGPATAVVVTLLAWLLHTLITFNIYGILLALVSTFSFTLPAIYIMRRFDNPNGMIVGLVVASILTIAASLLGNLVITPIYLHVPVDVVISLIPKLLLPFNVIKAAILSVATALVARPIKHALAQITTQ